MKDKIIIGGLVVAMILSLFALFSGGETIIEKGERVIEKIGAVPGKEVDEWTIGGLQNKTITVKHQSATTTLCAVKNPFTATSTLSDIVIRYAGAGVPTSTQFQVATTTEIRARGYNREPHFGGGSNSLPIMRGSTVANSGDESYPFISMYATTSAPAAYKWTGSTTPGSYQPALVGANDWVVFYATGTTGSVVGNFLTTTGTTTGSCSFEFTR